MIVVATATGLALGLAACGTESGDGSAQGGPDGTAGQADRGPGGDGPHLSVAPGGGTGSAAGGGTGSAADGSAEGSSAGDEAGDLGVGRDGIAWAVAETFAQQNATAAWEADTLVVTMDGDAGATMAGWGECRAVTQLVGEGDTVSLAFPNGRLDCGEVLEP